MKNVLSRLLVLSAVTLGASTARASDFVDTRLSFVFADDNLLAGPGETNPNSPPPRFGAGNQNNQFYDNFNTRFSGFETLSHAILYTHAPSFFPGLNTEAALAVLLLEKPSGEIGLRDDSSYIRLSYRPSSWSEKEGISLTGFPVSADRFRLGYAYRISWGGSSVFGGYAQNKGVPGAKLQITRDRWYAFAGAKSALIYNDIIKEETTAYGGLFGAGVDVLPILRLDASGGFFQKGVIPGLATQGVNAPVNAVGGSVRAELHVGAPVGTSVDFQLYKNDPDVFQKLFAPEQYPGGLSYTFSVEGSELAQSLSNPDVFAKTQPQQARAVAVQARVKYNYLRAHLLALYRTLSFIQFDVPGVPPYSDFPEGTDQQPEMFLAAGADYNFPGIHLTPGVIFGVQQPAAFTSPQPVFTGTEYLGRRTVVIRDVNLFAILPPDTKTLPILSAKANARWDISEVVAAIGEVYWTRDPNRATFIQDISGVTQEVFEKEDGLGFNAILQARF